MFFHRPGLLCTVAASFFLVPALAAMELPAGKCAALQFDGEEFRVSGDLADVLSPDIATDAQGNYVVVYSIFNARNTGTDRDRHGIFGRRFAADGTPLGSEFQVNTVEEDEQRWPSVSVAPDGRFVVVWRSGAAFQPQSVRGRTFNANGSPTGPDFAVSTLPVEINTAWAVSVAMGPSGQFLATWDATTSAGNDTSRSVQARRFSFAGTPQGAQFQVNTTIDSTQQAPAVAVGPDGSYWIVWESFRSSGNDGSSASIQMRRFGVGGQPLSNEVQVNSFTAGAQRNPHVAVSPLGNALVVFQSDGSPGSDQDDLSVQAQGYSFDGSPVGAQFQINQRTLGDQFEPVVTAGVGGDFVVAWTSEDSFEMPREFSSVNARHIAAPGRFFDIEFRVNTSIEKDQENPAIAASPLGAMAVYYSDTVGSSIEFTTLAQRLTPTIAPDSLCLNSRRFLVEVDWRDATGTTGRGQAVVGGSDDSGLFWFFDANNWEMLVKVLDACPLNQRHWVFAAATTDIQYTLRVTDLVTGDTSEYFNPLGNASAAITDSNAFATCDANPSALPPEDRMMVTRRIDLLDPPEGVSVRSFQRDLLEEPGALPGWSLAGGGGTGRPFGDVASANAGLQQVDSAQCSSGNDRLCLTGSRFRAVVDWRNAQGQTGRAQAVPFGSADSGLFWFFDANNWEMLVKVLDACPLNDRYWVFSAATTDVQYTLTVTDTATGATREYFNPLNNAAAAITDTQAFATCP